METKICSYCYEEKNIEEFRFSNGYYRGECKKCEKIKNKKYREENKKRIYLKQKEYKELHKEEISKKAKLYRTIEKYKLRKKIYDERYKTKHLKKIQEYKKHYYKENNEKLSNYRKQYYIKNKENILLKNKEYREKNKIKMKIYQKNYKEINKDKLAQYRLEHRTQKRINDKIWRKKNLDKVKEYYKKNTLKIKQDPILKLKNQLRNMMKDAFKRRKFKKSKRFEEICCCTIDELIEHLIRTYENNYNEKWSWDFVNYIHIDHKTPLANAQSEEDVIKLCHYSNLQLLKAEDNLKKGAKIDYQINL